MSGPWVFFFQPVLMSDPFIPQVLLFGKFGVASSSWILIASSCVSEGGGVVLCCVGESFFRKQLKEAQSTTGSGLFNWSSSPLWPGPVMR